MSEAAFDYAAFIEQIRDRAPTARYATMGAEAFAAFQRTVGNESRALRDLPVIAIYSRDMPDTAVWVFDAGWNLVRELAV